LGSRRVIPTIAHTSFTISPQSRQIPEAGIRAFSSASQANKRRNYDFIVSLGTVTAFFSLGVYLYHSGTGLVRMGLTTGSLGCVDDNPSETEVSFSLFISISNFPSTKINRKLALNRPYCCEMWKRAEFESRGIRVPR
jgi:hypothetical protein